MTAKQQLSLSSSPSLGPFGFLDEVMTCAMRIRLLLSSLLPLFNAIAKTSGLEQYQKQRETKGNLGNMSADFQSGGGLGERKRKKKKKQEKKREGKNAGTSSGTPMYPWSKSPGTSGDPILFDTIPIEHRALVYYCVLLYREQRPSLELPSSFYAAYFCSFT